MTATIIYGHKRRDAMVAESEARPFDLGMTDEAQVLSAPKDPNSDLVFTAVTLIRLMSYLT